MYRRKTFWLACAVIEAILVCCVSAQNANAPAPSPGTIQAVPPKAVTFSVLVDPAIAQERRLSKLMRNFKPIVETYVQEEKRDPRVQTSPRTDHYFLSRLDFTG